jgi:hypothetical protein
MCKHNGPRLDKIKKAIVSKQTPLIRLWRRTENRDNIELEVVPYQKDKQYIAISHAWSDGRGNQQDNSLPRCQLSHLYDLCNLQRGLPVWMDTLCIPRKDEDTEFRTEAIRNMNEIFLNASDHCYL